MQHIACSFALLVSNHLAALSLALEGTESSLGNESHTDAQKRIFEACRLLFNAPERKDAFRRTRDYVALFADKSLECIDDIPVCLRRIFVEWDIDEKRSGELWNRLVHSASQICALILAFSHVLDLTACEDMPLSGIPDLLDRSSLSRRLKWWDGQSEIQIGADAWLEIIILMMTGHRESTADLDQVCLQSDKGWSVYINTFGDGDPGYLGTLSPVSIASGNLPLT